MKLKNLSLPINRVQQFKFIYRTAPLLTMKLSLIMFLFAVPFFAQISAFLFLIGPIVNDKTSDMLVIYSNIANLIKVISLFSMITIPLLFLGIHISMYILKKVIYNDGYIFRIEFKNSFKEIFKPFVIIILDSILIVLMTLGLFSLNIKDDMTIFILLLFIYIFFIFITFTFNNYCLLFNIYYEEKIINIFKNSFIFVFNCLFSNLIIILGFFSIFITSFLLDFILFSRYTFLTLFSTILYAFILLGNFVLVFQLNAVYKFDELININQFQDCYHLGLYKDE